MEPRTVRLVPNGQALPCPTQAASELPEQATDSQETPAVESLHQLAEVIWDEHSASLSRVMTHTLGGAV